MIAADAMKGLLEISADARVTVLTDHVSSDDPIRYTNSVVVAPDGTIYAVYSFLIHLAGTRRPAIEHGSDENALLTALSEWRTPSGAADL